MTYKVALKTKSDAEVPITLSIAADDVRIETCSCEGDNQTCDHATDYFNFVKGDDDKAKTVAAIPFNEVLYITS